MLVLIIKSKPISKVSLSGEKTCNCLVSVRGYYSTDALTIRGDKAEKLSGLKINKKIRLKHYNEIYDLWLDKNRITAFNFEEVK